MYLIILVRVNFVEEFQEAMLNLESNQVLGPHMGHWVAWTELRWKDNLWDGEEIKVFLPFVDIEELYDKVIVR